MFSHVVLHVISMFHTETLQCTCWHIFSAFIYAIYWAPPFQLVPFRVMTLSCKSTAFKAVLCTCPLGLTCGESSLPVSYINTDKSAQTRTENISSVKIVPKLGSSISSETNTSTSHEMDVLVNLTALCIGSRVLLGLNSKFIKRGMFKAKLCFFTNCQLLRYLRLEMKAYFCVCVGVTVSYLYLVVCIWFSYLTAVVMQSQNFLHVAHFSPCICVLLYFICVHEFCICVMMYFVVVCVFALPLWPPLSCRVLPTCWLSRPNEQSLLRIGFMSILAQNICVFSFLYLCIHVSCICVFPDWEKLTSSHSYEWASKASSLNPNYLCFSKSIVLRVYSFSRAMFTRTILALAGTFCWHRMHVRSNCAFTFFQHICQEFSGQLLNSQTFWSCLFVKRFVFLCTDLS